MKTKQSRNLLLLVMGMMLLVLVICVLNSCGTNNTSTDAVPYSSAVIDPIVSESPEPSIEPVTVKYSALIPNPKETFTDGRVSVVDGDDGDGYMVEVRDFTEDEYDAYVELTQSTGFDNVSYDINDDSGRFFGAYSTDNQYWVQIEIGPGTDETDQVLYIMCQKASNDE